MVQKPSLKTNLRLVVYPQYLEGVFYIPDGNCLAGFLVAINSFTSVHWVILHIFHGETIREVRTAEWILKVESLT